MPRTQQELLTQIHSAEAELELMAGYQDEYPQHYAALEKELDKAEEDYARAMAQQAAFAPKEPKSAPRNKRPHIAAQRTIRVAGGGDRIVLLHAEEVEPEGSKGAGNSATPPPHSPERKPGDAPSDKQPEGQASPPASTDDSEQSSNADQGSAARIGEEFQKSPPEPQSLTIEKVTADAWQKGYGNFHLRSDVAKLYEEIHAEVKQRGGVITSSGGIRSLTAPVGAARSATSFHYTGRALDLYIYSGMVDPKKDPYIVVRERARVYRVYARCDAASAEVSELSNVMTYHKRDGSLSAAGSFFDLTALFAQYGFKPIRARSNFESGGPQLGAEFWHFQCELGLEDGKSTFGGELLAIYSESTLKPTPPWNSRNHVFGVNWK